MTWATTRFTITKHATVLTRSPTGAVRRKGTPSPATRICNLLATSGADDTIAPLEGGPRPGWIWHHAAPGPARGWGRHGWALGLVVDRVHGELLHDGVGAGRRADPGSVHRRVA